MASSSQQETLNKRGGSYMADKIILTEDKLQRGESICIHFKSEDWPYGYAQCTYLGQRGGKHIFESDTYGWKYFVDPAANTVVNEENPDKIYELDNVTGWTKYLPEIKKSKSSKSKSKLETKLEEAASRRQPASSDTPDRKNIIEL